MRPEPPDPPRADVRDHKMVDETLAEPAAYFGESQWRNAISSAAERREVFVGRERALELARTMRPLLDGLLRTCDDSSQRLFSMMEFVWPFDLWLWVGRVLCVDLHEEAASRLAAQRDGSLGSGTNLQEDWLGGRTRIRMMLAGSTSTQAQRGARRAVA
ncbi:hypothetical protein T492DRAFT_1011702 [Pavlovales sp. CCMP2436]|nr:hypothetical protein T492DRAFT_1011702 [Pavlovales sp. CCMP2436]